MPYKKTLKDAYADDIVVAEEGTGSVFLTVHDTYAVDGRSAADLKPEAARALAKALKRAANVAEGKPAKAKKKPRRIHDGDGDTWHLCPNGLYSMDEGNPDANKTADYIRENYGAAVPV